MVWSFSRRGLLRRAALAGGALVLPSGLLTSCTPPKLGPRRTDHYVVFYLLVGGWDLLLTTDPTPQKNTTFATPYGQRDVVVAGDVRLGPAMKPLRPFFDRTAIVRGLYVDTLNHPQARFRMVTGQFKPPGTVVTAPSVQSLIAAARSSAYELPNLSADQLRPATFRGVNDPLRLEPVRVSSVQQLRSLTGVDAHDVVNHQAEISAALHTLDEQTAEHWNTPLAKDFAGFADLERALGASDYGDRVASSASLLHPLRLFGATGRVDKQVELAIEAVRLDLAPVVTLGTGEFDSHTRRQYASHPEDVKNALQGIADIAHGLQAIVDDDGRTLLDKTTIVVTSEFSRTPSLNELGGKHHWPTNAMIMLGKGVRPGVHGQPRVFGSVDENLAAEAINPRNGSRKRGAELLDMSHALATVLAVAGLDPQPLIQQEPIVDLLA